VLASRSVHPPVYDVHSAEPKNMELEVKQVLTYASDLMGGEAMPRNVALNWIAEHEKEITEVSDRIWEYAEVGLQELKSSRLIAERLAAAGFEVDSGVADMPTAIVASYGSGKPAIGILAEYDALAGLSQKPIPVKEPVSSGAPGHGCGHNLFGAMSMGAAIAIKEAMKQKELEGTVKLFGCPAEETLVGKVFMVKAGLFDGIDAVLSWHPSSTNTVDLGSSNAMNSVKFDFHGVTAHAAANPEQGRSALDAVELMNMGVNYLREHVIEKARIHYVITHGGGQPNVVPAFAQVWYYVRAPRREQVDELHDRIIRIGKGASLMTETTMDVRFLVGCYNVLPNKPLNCLMLKNLKEVGPPSWTAEEIEFARKINESITSEQKKTVMESSRVPRLEEKLDLFLDDRTDDPESEGTVMAGSTDVGDVSWVAPTGQLLVATYNLGVPVHSWQVTAASGMSIGHKGGILASKVMALTGVDLIMNPEELAKIRGEFEELTKRSKYVSPLPEGLKPPFDQLPQH